MGKCSIDYVTIELDDRCCSNPRPPLGFLFFFIHAAKLVQQEGQLFAAVRKNGGTAWHLVGTNEGHGFAKKENADYNFWTSLLFWKQYLLN